MSPIFFQGGSRTANDYIASHEYASKTATENNDSEMTYKPLVQNFYSTATDFYTFGWSQSFHFAPRNRGEGFQASLVRHEHYLASRLGIEAGQDVVDLGCGVCGPLVNIAKFTRASITGLTIEEYQVTKGSMRISQHGLEKSCKVLQGDFHEIPFPPCSFDRGYDIEASAHSTQLIKYFQEVHRVLKPGGIFGGYAWVATSKYDASNPEEKQIMDGIAYGNGIAFIHTFEDYSNAIAAVPGLELVEDFDVAKLGDDFEWYEPLLPKYTLDGILATRAGRMFTATLTRVLEATGLAPVGAYETTKVLEAAAVCLVEGGIRGIYTPMHFYKVVKKA